jgi:hypothetical protein
LHAFKRLAIRWEYRADIHQGLVMLACCVICWRYLDSSSDISSKPTLDEAYAMFGCIEPHLLRRYGIPVPRLQLGMSVTKLS